jgi:hypothetical protein
MRHAERLWHLARSYGLVSSFKAGWVEGLSVMEAASRLDAYLPSAAERDWRGAHDNLPPYEAWGAMWVGELNERWIQYIQIQGYHRFSAVRDLSAPGGRAIYFEWTVNGGKEIVYAENGDHAMYFVIDGIQNGKHGRLPHALDAYATGLTFDLSDQSWRTDPDRMPGWLEFSDWRESAVQSGARDEELVIPPHYEKFVGLAEEGYTPAAAECFTSALELIGGITGREFDKEWMDGVHTRYDNVIDYCWT